MNQAEVRGHIIFKFQTRNTLSERLSRPVLYKALADGSKPQFETIMKVSKAIGGQIQINPMAT